MGSTAFNLRCNLSHIRSTETGSVRFHIKYSKRIVSTNPTVFQDRTRFVTPAVIPSDNNIIFCMSQAIHILDDICSTNITWFIPGSLLIAPPSILTYLPTFYTDNIIPLQCPVFQTEIPGFLSKHIGPITGTRNDQREFREFVFIHHNLEILPCPFQIKSGSRSTQNITRSIFRIRICISFRQI